MLIRDIMTTNVISIPSDTSVIEAKRVMDKRKLRRAPVVEKGKLVGLLSSKRLERAAPRKLTSSTNIWDMAYNIVTLHQKPVKEVMETEVVTARPDMTIEEAVALAQAKKVGALVVVDNDNIVGIVTTNDIFYQVVNPVLGVGEPGERIWVAGGGESKPLEEIISLINKLCMDIITLHIIAAPKATKKDLVVHLDCKDVSKLVAELKNRGYKVESRKR
ncbi:MAG: CBS domain-containing protein [Dehalococcoidales bacterium]